MPGRDKTGPMGMGPATGRGAGSCALFAAPGYLNAGLGQNSRLFGKLVCRRALMTGGLLAACACLAHYRAGRSGCKNENK
jgi:hypothetical protein